MYMYYSVILGQPTLSGCAHFWKPYHALQQRERIDDLPQLSV